MRLEAHITVARLAAEREVLARLNAGYGFAPRRGPLETYLVDDDARARVGRDRLRPVDTHAESLAEAEAALTAALAAEASADTPLAALIARLRLAPGEARLLTMAVAHALDVDVRALCEQLSNTPRLSSSVCQRLFAADVGDPLALASLLHSRGTLRRLELVATDDAARTLTVGPLVLPLLGGDTRVPQSLVGAIDETAPPARMFLPEVVDERLAELVSILEADDATATAVLIGGGQGSGKRAAAEAIAARLGRPILALGGDSRTDLATLSSALAFARLRGDIVYLPGLELFGGATDAAGAADPRRGANRERARDIIDAHDDVLLLGTRETGVPALRLARPLHAVVLPRPTLDIRVGAWARGLEGITGFDAEAAETLAARYVIGTGAVAEVIDDADKYAQATRQDVALEHIEDAIGRRLSLNLGVLGQRITRRARFEEMVLPEDVIDTLADLIAMVRGRSQILETWGYERHLGISRGVSALFSGEPGTGKTMAASVISSELGLELFRIDLSSVVSKWVGETEKNLARIFDEAQDAQAMLLFDEADSLFGKRTDVQSASDRYANLEVNYVLQRMEQFDGISILTSNLEAGIDQAFMRRLNFRVRFPEPEEEEREVLWRKLLPPEAGLKDVDLSELAARFEMTGGHIRNAIVRAAVVASREGRPMEAGDLYRGAHHEYYELGKVMHSELR